MSAGLTLTVEQLNEYVRRSLASDPILHGVRLRGEISNFKRHTSGHWYFTLKDSQSAINCAMFRQATFGVGFQPRDGQQVVLLGNVGLYVKTGQYQFYADAMEQDGVGDLYARFEALKAKLNAEGLFDASRKKPLPLLPKAVGVVTSRTGAVIHDIQQVAWRRNPGMPIVLYPSQVQGESAAREIARGVKALDKLPEVEVIIVGRGGGSMEDLWAFNEEIVARAIYACKTPVVSAVGHETDFTIADFVADVRAATPSMAAEIVVEERDALLAMVGQMERRLYNAAQSGLQARSGMLSELRRRLAENSPARRLDAIGARLAADRERLTTLTTAALTEKAHALQKAALRIRSASPDATLARGYAIVTSGGTVLRDAGRLRLDDSVTIRLQSGAFDARVERVRKEKVNAQERAEL